MKMPFDNQGDAIDREAPPDRVALIDVGAGKERSYSYADLRRLSGAIAAGLLKRGLKRGDRVGILSANRAEVLLSFLGTMQAGLVSVPINWKLPAETVRYIVDDSDAKLVLGDEARLALAPDSVSKLSFDSTEFAAMLDETPMAPVRMQPDEAAVYDFCTELFTRHAVSDETYGRLHQFLDDRQIVDLTLLQGLYVTVASVMAMADQGLPPGTELAFKPGEP